MLLKNQTSYRQQRLDLNIEKSCVPKFEKQDEVERKHANKGKIEQREKLAKEEN
jgi:hypothetical protein